MLCRKTKIALIYVIRDKTIANLVPLMKKHIPGGSIIYTDSHMSYCSNQRGVSKLSKHGWYHFWTNHSIRMVHEKFPFCHSMTIENAWGDIKTNCVGMKFTMKYDKI